MGRNGGRLNVWTRRDEEEEGGLGHGVGLERSITGASGARVQYMKEEGTWAMPGERGLA
jgi:hypothetical protein